MVVHLMKMRRQGRRQFQQQSAMLLIQQQFQRHDRVQQMVAATLI
jgi:hypothetical protein